MHLERLAPAVLAGCLQGLRFAWPLWLSLGLIVAAKLGARLFWRRRLLGAGIGDIDKMDGRTFERYLEAGFRRLGYAVELTRPAGDFGDDLVARKGDERTVIQAKSCRRKIGVKAV